MKQKIQVDVTPEIKLFDDLSFCWDYFERDGLTDESITHFSNNVKSPVLVVGGGQGLISQRLREAGHEVCTLEIHQSMADLAWSRRKVESIVVDFMNFESPQKFATIIINTGVVYPSFIESSAEAFVEKIDHYTHDNGVIALSFLHKTAFDHAVSHLELHHNQELLGCIWDYISKEKSIFDALTAYHLELPRLAYLLSRFKKELLEYELQIKTAGIRFFSISNDDDVREFIIQSLHYVSYGLNFREQLALLSTFERSGIFCVKSQCCNNLTVNMLKKS